MNVCIFSGRLGQDPEMRQTQSGKAVCNFSLAVDTGTKDAQGKKIADWFRFVAWEKTADVIAQYCRKGDSIMVQASAHTKVWTDKQGIERKDIEFTVFKMDFGAKSQNSQGGQAPQRAPQPARQAPRGQYNRQGPGAGPAERDPDADFHNHFADQARNMSPANDDPFGDNDEPVPF